MTEAQEKQAAAAQYGPLTPRAFAELLKKVTGARAVAYLLVSDGKAEKCVFFTAGGLRLSSVGMRRGRSAVDAVLAHPHLDAEQRKRIEHARKRVAEARARGELADEGPADPANEAQSQVRLNALEEVLGGPDLRKLYHDCCREVVRDELIDMLVWDGAEFEFREGNPPTKLFSSALDATKLSLGVKDVLEEVQKLGLEWQKLQQKLGNPTRTVIKATGGGAGAKDDLEAAVLETVRSKPPGDCTLDDVVLATRRIGADAIQVCRAVEAQEKGGGLHVDAKPPPPTAEQRRRRTVGDLDKIEQALQLMIQQLVARKRMAACFEELGDVRKAIENWRHVGEELQAGRRPEEAIDSYRNIVRLSPEAFFAREKIAGLYEQLGKVPEAIKEWLDLARLFGKLRLFHRATGGMRKVVALAPEDLDHRRRLGDLLEAQGKKDEAAKEYEELAKRYEAAGRHDEALAAFQRIARLVPDHAAAQERLRRAAKYGAAIVGPVAVLVAVALGLLGGGAWIHARYSAIQAFAAARARSLEQAHASQYPEARATLDQFVVEHDAFDRTRVDAVRAVVDGLAKDEATSLLARATTLDAQGQVADARVVLRQVEAGFAGTPWGDEAAMRLARYVGMEQEAEREVAVVAELSTDPLKVAEALKRGRDLVQRFGWTAAAKKVLLPLELRTTPAGASVTADAAPVPGRTPLVITRPPAPPIAVRITLDGYQPYTTTVDLLSPQLASPLKVDLQKAPRWRLETLGPLADSPWVAVEGIVVGGSDQRVYGVGWGGETRWTHRLDLFATTAGPPVGTAETVVFADTTGKVTAVEPRGGEVRWTKPLEGDDVRTVDVLGAGVVLSTRARLLLLDLATGEPSWAVDLPDALAAPPQVAGGKVFAALIDGQVLVIDGEGKTTGRVQAAGRPCAPPVITPAGCVVGTETGELSLVWRETAWTVKLAEPLSAAPLVVENVVYAPAGRKLVAISLDGGRVKWERDLGAPLGTPAHSAGRLYVGASDGTVHALLAPSGEPRWVFRTHGRVSATPVVHRGTVLVASGDDLLYAIPD